MHSALQLAGVMTRLHELSATPETEVLLYQVLVKFHLCRPFCAKLVQLRGECQSNGESPEHTFSG